MRGFATNAHRDPLRALRAACELALRWLAVDEKSARGGQSVRGARAVGALLFPDDEEQIDTFLTALREAVRGAEHRGGNPFRVRRATTGEPVTLQAWRQVWGNGVEMSGERDAATAARRPHIRASACHFLQIDVPTARNEPSRDKIDGATLGARRRIDCQQ